MRQQQAVTVAPSRHRQPFRPLAPALLAHLAPSSHPRFALARALALSQVDEQEIDDPAAKKPDGYDDIPAQIPDPDATKPEDWDDEDDGEWEPPLIDNPEFKGEWIAPKVSNPDYKGEWSPKQIKNDKYEEGVQLAAYEKMTYIGFELWVVNNGTIFDNILVTDDLEYAKAQGEKLFKPTKDGEKEKKEAWDKENKPADEPMPDDEEGEGEGGGDDEEEKDEL